ncbi:MAG: pyridoxamine 5'-phosphate oxidase family protein [bacterium]
MSDAERATDHRGSQVLSREDCDRLLSTTPIGRVAFLQGGETHILPVNYVFDEGEIVIRTTAGSKMEAAEMHHRFAFEIDEWDEEARSGWSVLAHGMGEVINDAAEIERLKGLGLATWAGEGRSDLWMKIRLDDVTGRRVG